MFYSPMGLSARDRHPRIIVGPAAIRLRHKARWAKERGPPTSKYAGELDTHD